MKSTHAFAVLAAVTFLAGCQTEGARKLAGRWDLLPPDKVQNEDAASNTASMYDSVAEGEITGTMSLVFHSNGTLETFTDFPMASSGKAKVGRWSTRAWDPEAAVLTIHCQIFDEQTETRVRFINDDTIQLIPPNIDVLKTEMQFRRNE